MRLDKDRTYQLHVESFYINEANAYDTGLADEVYTIHTGTAAPNVYDTAVDRMSDLVAVIKGKSYTAAGLQVGADVSTPEQFLNYVRIQLKDLAGAPLVAVNDADASWVLTLIINAVSS